MSERVPKPGEVWTNEFRGCRVLAVEEEWVLYVSDGTGNVTTVSQFVRNLNPPRDPLPEAAPRLYANLYDDAHGSPTYGSKHHADSAAGRSRLAVATYVLESVEDLRP